MRKRKDKQFKNIIIRLILTLLVINVALNIPIDGRIPSKVYANFDASLLDNKDRDTNDMITDRDREVAYVYLIEQMKRLEALNNLSEEARLRMEAVFYQANVYIANTDMTVKQLISYMNSIDADIQTASDKNMPDANQFLYLSNSNPITSSKYGQDTLLVLSVINLGDTLIRDIVLTPVVDTDPKKWPFVIKTASDVRMIEVLPAADSVEQSFELRMDIGWEFTVKQDALTGTYPLTFHARYYRNDVMEETDLTTYINIAGAPGSGYLNEDPEDNKNVSMPRIIVTGFTTDPEQVFAGDTFNLKISVQNTSQRTAVSNIQFDLRAAQEGANKETTYEAFLPTSGSATIFVNSIPAGGSTDIEIEMTARSDLAQKPYVIEVHAAYEDEKNNPYDATTNVSIPVHQKARIDTGEVEIMPDNIEIGGSSNIMFPIYNKGKTTLYNVQADFVGDSIEGGSTFVGKIEPGATGNVDAMVSGVAPTTDDGTIKAIISYEDEAGNVSTIEKEMTVYVNEVFEDVYYDDMMPDDMMREGKKGISAWLKWLIAGITVAALAAVALIVIKKRKKKKAAEKELEELEIDDLDETEDDA